MLLYKNVLTEKGKKKEECDVIERNSFTKNGISTPTIRAITTYLLGAKHRLEDCPKIDNIQTQIKNQIRKAKKVNKKGARGCDNY